MAGVHDVATTSDQDGGQDADGMKHLAGIQITPMNEKQRVSGKAMVGWHLQEPFGFQERRIICLLLVTT